MCMQTTPVLLPDSQLLSIYFCCQCWNCMTLCPVFGGRGFKRKFTSNFLGNNCKLLYSMQWSQSIKGVLVQHRVWGHRCGTGR